MNRLTIICLCTCATMAGDASAGTFAIRVLDFDGSPLKNQVIDVDFHSSLGSDSLGTIIDSKRPTTSQNGNVSVQVGNSSGFESPQVALRITVPSRRAFGAVVPSLARNENHNFAVVLAPEPVRTYQRQELLVLALDGLGCSFRIRGSEGLVSLRQPDGTLRIEGVVLQRTDDQYSYFDREDNPATQYAIGRNIKYRSYQDRFGRTCCVPASIPVWISRSAGDEGSWALIGWLKWTQASTSSLISGSLPVTRIGSAIEE